MQAAWPGATLQETIDQVTERIERTLKETPGLDFLRSFTSAGSTTIFVTLKGSTPASEVPDIWYHVRKSVGDMRHTLPAGVVGPGFNDEFGDTFGIIYGFTADGFTHRELRDHVENVRARLLRVPDVSKVEILGTQDETDHRRVLHREDGRTGHRSRRRLSRRCGRRTRSIRPARCRPATRGSRCASPAPSAPSRTSWRSISPRTAA